MKEETNIILLLFKSAMFNLSFSGYKASCSEEQGKESLVFLKIFVR